MLALAGAPLGLRCLLLDPDPRCAASDVADILVGPLDDPSLLQQLTRRCSVTTFEIEHTNPEALAQLVGDGAVVHPAPQLLSSVADKQAQKRFLFAQGIPVPAIIEPTFTNRGEVRSGCVQKARYGGYDGRGVAVLSPGETPPLQGACFYEELIAVDQEIAVITARSQDGEIRTWEPLAMGFTRELNLVEDVSVPAGLSSELRDQCNTVARRTAEVMGRLGLVGVMAVEQFVDDQGRVLVNEVAPRPHNSGHLTIEASITSQFEQHLRAILGLPLGDTTLRSPAVMKNIVGAANETSGAYAIGGLAAALKNPDTHIHLYNKPVLRPGRKMGHVTALAPTVPDARAAAAAAAAALYFTPEEAQ